MNIKLILLAISIATFSSCTTLYKSGQTPDDVYYSPNRPYGDGEVKKSEQRDEVRENTNSDLAYNNNADIRYNRNNRLRYNSFDDRCIRLGINDRRWRNFDNDYLYNPYNYGFNYGYYYNPYFWPYPVYSPIFLTTPNPKNTTPRIANLGGYNSGYNKTPVNPKSGNVKPARGYNNTYNNSNRGSAVGNVIRQVLSPANTNTNNSNNSGRSNNSSNNTRTYTPSTNSNSSSSGNSSSGSGNVSRPPRSGRN